MKSTNYEARHDADLSIILSFPQP